LTKRKCLGESVENYPEDYAGDVLGEMYGGEFFFGGGDLSTENI